MGTPEVGAVVVGGGVAGLAAAVELGGALSDVVLLDASDRPGGVMRTDHVDGYVVERGPSTFQVKAPMLASLRERGLESSLREASPESRLRWLLRRGRLEPVPMSLRAFTGTDLLARRAKLRLLAEPFVRRRDASAESVAEFLGRRLGDEVVSALAGPFLTGIYAGDERELGAEAVFGGLVEFERRWGSIALGALAGAVLRRGERGLRGTWSMQEGLGPFARRLAELLADPPVLGARVVALRVEAGLWHLDVESSGGASSLRSARLVLAVPSYAAAELLRAADPGLAVLLGAIAYAPIVALPLGVAASDLRRAPEGFGFLVPRDEGMALLGCLFMSRVFPGRAPPEHQLLQCMLGGVRWSDAAVATDDELLARAGEGVDVALGLAGEPQVLGITRWPRAIPQPARDHVARVAAIRAREGDLPGLALAGGYLDGVAVADAYASGLTAARRLIRLGRGSSGRRSRPTRGGG